VGVLSSSSSSEAELRAIYAIDRTPDGDAALAQARSGSRRGLSVGVDLEADGFTVDPEDPERMLVTAGRLAETSLVAMAGFAGAGVDQIAAGKPTEGERAMSETPKPPEPETPEPEEDDNGEEPEVEPESRARAQRRPALVIAERAAPDMRLGEYVQTLVRAERGDRGARARIEAALTRENVTTNPGVVPIAYVDQVIDSPGADRPLFDAMDHADMPASGMTIRRPEITTRPDGGFPATTRRGSTSAVAIGNHDVNVRQWAGCSAMVALVERSSPSYVEEVFGQRWPAITGRGGGYRGGGGRGRGRHRHHDRRGGGRSWPRIGTIPISSCAAGWPTASCWMQPGSSCSQRIGDAAGNALCGDGRGGSADDPGDA
jgi:hypothetical protein